MKTISSISQFREWRKEITESVGFVPTMGALHKGHLSLVQKSNETCNHTVVSIYVNPKQFAPGEDLIHYPRTLDEDLKKLDSFTVDAVFLPNNEVMYPDGFSTKVNEEILSNFLEGNSRPSFFQGVTTVVAKLFNIIQPSHAFFGEKDAQQLAIINRMVTDLNFPIEIISCPLIREENGLAMSSRNVYLSNDEKEVAAHINLALEDGKSQLYSGQRDPQIIRNIISNHISEQQLLKIDYVSVADANSLTEITESISGDILVSVAVYLGDTRLIDNFSYSPSSNK